MFKAQTKNNTNSKSNNTSPFQNGKATNSFIQPALKVGQRGDKYEVEADRIADQVVANATNTQPESSFFTPSSLVQNKVQGNNNAQFFEGQTSLIQTVAEEEELQLAEKEQSLDSAQEQIQETSEPDNVSLKNESLSVQLNIDNLSDERIQEQEEEEEEPVQTKSVIQKIDDEQAPEEELQLLQAKSDSLDNTASIESDLNGSSGGGSSMSDSTKSEMESGFGTDFSNVNIHTDSNAVQMNQNLGAQAFTHGNDIYFNEGKYSPGNDSGKHLLAHELTHTVQQGASVQPKMIQKVDGDENSNEMLATGIRDDVNSTIRFESLAIPPFKKDMVGAGYNGEIHRPKGYARTLELGAPQNDWKEATGTSNNVKNKLRDLLAEEFNGAQNVRNDATYVFRTVGTAGFDNKNRYVVGNLDESTKEFASPAWNKEGNPRSFQVDHILELQLGGEHNIDNLHLLSSGINRSSGFAIKRRIDQKVKSHLRSRGEEENNQNLNNVLSNYELVFNQAIGDAAPYAFQNFDQTKDWWQADDIRQGRHFDVPNFNRLIDVSSMERLGSANEYFLFPGQSGWIPRRFRNTPRIYADEKSWLKPWEVTAKGIEEIDNEDILTSLTIALPERSVTGRSRIKYKSQPPEPFEINKYPGAKYAGYLNKTAFQQRAIELKALSPINFDQFEISDSGIQARGQILPTIPIIRDIGLEFMFDNGELTVFKQFNSGEVNIPTPFEISNMSLILSASTESGLGIEGQVDFGINNVGEGHIGAAASTGEGFELEGAFNFDSELFDPAEINVEYKDEIWTIGGEIGIPEGKVRGVKNATITASYSENNFTATGEAELDIPGIERGTMTVNYGDEGFSISGNFDLSSDIPGIRSGNVEARVAKEEGAENYDVMVSGTAQPDIPGIDSSLTVTYENGAITIEGSASYERGMLSGNVNIGATNRAIGEDGEPSGEPDDTMRVYGGGDLTLQLTPWLEATAGVQFLPNGEIEVTGRIALPSAVDVFDRREFRRNLFTVPTIEIPLFAIPLGPRSIGLVAQISGGLDFAAGFGPGQLRDVYAEVTYNPDREDETQITGHGEFAIPADAGLTLRGDLGLGVSIGIASLSGGIELAGTLGLEGEAAAEVDLSWSPQTGIILDAQGRIMVNPKFTFDVNAFARASLGIGWFSISETWRHNLVSFSWGPDIQFGVVFPVHYQEDQPFDISFDDIEVIYPDLDVVDMAKDLAGDIKDDIFD